MPRAGLEPIQIAPHAPQTCAATTRSTRTSEGCEVKTEKEQ
jgi:hypothetical protein